MDSSIFCSGPQADELRLGIAMTPGVDAMAFSRIEASEVTAEQFFRLKAADLAEAVGVDRKFDINARREALQRAGEELSFIRRHGVKATFATDRTYPVRLAQLVDAPAVIFSLGAEDFNPSAALSVVGTRRPTPYGVKYCKEIVCETADMVADTAIVSGLAYGIDACAHKAALEVGAPTYAVVAHGLDMVYPAAHRDLARCIAKGNGAIISEYPSNERPYRRRFLERNRIIAALSDATLVVESGVRGGALSTANTAFDLDRDVFALPGRLGDEMSEGCNALIFRQKAHIFTSVRRMVETVGWKPRPDTKETVQGQLFPEISDELMPVYKVLKQDGGIMYFDEILSASGLTVEQTMTALNELEFDGLVFRHPGNRYSV